MISQVVLELVYLKVAYSGHHSLDADKSQKTLLFWLLCNNTRFPTLQINLYFVMLCQINGSKYCVRTIKCYLVVRSWTNRGDTSVNRWMRVQFQS